MSVQLAPSQPIMVRTEEIVSWPRAASPIVLASIDLTQPFDLVLSAHVSFAMERAVDRLGILLAFRATLAPGIVLSTLAEDVQPENSWRYALWPSIDRPAFSRGASAIIDYTYTRGTTTLRVS